MPPSPSPADDKGIPPFQLRILSAQNLCPVNCILDVLQVRKTIRDVAYVNKENLFLNSRDSAEASWVW